MLVFLFGVVWWLLFFVFWFPFKALGFSLNVLILILMWYFLSQGVGSKLKPSRVYNTI